MPQKFLKLLNQYNKKEAHITRIPKRLIGLRVPCGKTMIQIMGRAELFMVIYEDYSCTPASEIQWIYNERMLRANFIGGNKCQTLPR